MNQYQTLTLESLPNKILKLTINRPSALNALNSQVLNELADALREIGEMSFEHVRVLIVTGAGEKAFVAGADIKEMSNMTESEARAFALRGQSVLHELSLLKIPVLAAVNGFALGGGCELALACDFIYASQNAKFGLPEVTLGLIPGFGGTVRLSRAVGLRKAREMTFTGGVITAPEALQMGLVNKVVESNALLSEVVQVAETIALRAPIAIGKAKFSINANWDLDIEEAQKNEAANFAELFTSEDVKEGTSAFLEKRKAQFKGI